MALHITCDDWMTTKDVFCITFTLSRPGLVRAITVEVYRVAVVIAVLILLSVLNMVFNVVFVFIPETIFHLLIPVWQWLAIALIGTLVCWGLAKS